MHNIVLLITALIALASADSARAANVAVLMPGSAGAVPGDFLVRNDARIKASGIRTVVTTSSSTATETIAAETAQGHKIVLVGMSKGTTDVASALASGAKPSGVVLVSGIYPAVMATLGSPDNCRRRSSCITSTISAAQRNRPSPASSSAGRMARLA